MVAAYFLDTSALAKRYLPEIGSPWIQTITAAATQNLLLVSQITWVELHSALSRRQREHDLTISEATLLQQAFSQHWTSQYYIVKADPDLLNRAVMLVQKHPLRAYDAIQLASALVIWPDLSTASDAKLTFLSADHRLLEIAQQEGLSTLNPNEI